jgi:hypothetical protein
MGCEACATSHTQGYSTLGSDLPLPFLVTDHVCRSESLVLLSTVSASDTGIIQRCSDHVIVLLHYCYCDVSLIAFSDGTMSVVMNASGDIHQDYYAKERHRHTKWLSIVFNNILGRLSTSQQLSTRVWDRSYLS